MAIKYTGFFADAENDDRFKTDEDVGFIVEGLFYKLCELEKGLVGNPVQKGLAHRVKDYRRDVVNERIDELQEAKRKKGNYMSTTEQDEIDRAEMAKFGEAPVYEIEIKVRKVGRIDKEGKFQEE